MKKFILLALFAALAMPQGAQADLVAGWDTWVAVSTNTYDATKTNSASGQVVGTITNGVGSLGGFSNATFAYGASTDGTWGSLSTAPTPSIVAADATDAVGLNATANGTFDFTITANAGSTIDFTSLNFDAWRRFANSANAWELSVLSGSITNGSITSGAVTQGNVTLADTDPHNFDIDLTGLADRTLAVGESAVFRLTFTGGNAGGNGGNNMMMDNVGIFGNVGAVPEPSSLAVLGLAGIGMLVRRRK
jgi:hypothetical protein